MALIDEYLDVARRWQAARQTMERTAQAGPNADSPERIAKFLQHQSDIAGGDLLWGGVPPPALTEQFGHERIIGQTDLISFSSLQKAIAIGRFVGRVSHRNQTGGVSAVGTGFMVSPRLMLTNNHVLPDRDEGGRYVIEFNYQLDENDAPLAVSAFALAPDEFFATNKELDYTLVAVAPAAQDGAPLEYFGWSKLNGREGKILKGHALNIIQHPEGAHKQIVLRGNRLLELCDHHFLYQTDTMRGSSGAPVYSDQWEVVALHHRSVPNVVDGKVMTIANVPWTDKMPESQIAWIGNEGVRVSSLVRHMTALRLNPSEERLRSEMFNSDPPNPFVISRLALGDSHGHGGRALTVNAGDDGNALDVSIALRIQLRFGAISVSAGSGGGNAYLQR